MSPLQWFTEPKFWILSHERGMFWRPNRLGYCERTDEAGVYTLTEAIEICYQANRFSGKIEESMIPVVQEEK